jgi:recombinational DNA repair ATPase RecF
MGGRQSRRTAGHGKIGERIFAEVERLTADGAMNRLAAFKQIATASGGKPGTVAANYYRIARKRGAALQPRRGRAPSQAGGGAGRVLATLRLLERQLQQQAEEIKQLRAENARFAKLRRLVLS